LTSFAIEGEISHPYSKKKRKEKEREREREKIEGTCLIK
jgi:hypothetical protein